MSDGIGRELLLSAIRIGDQSVWSVFHELAQIEEPERRRILRPHAEAGFIPGLDDPEMAIRRRLEEALGPLTLFEIGLEIDVLTADDLPPVELPDLETLIESNAFLRYSNAYLYFGIRLLAGRLSRPDFMGGSRPCGSPQFGNRQEFALEFPPPIPHTVAVEEALARFVQQKNSEDTREALKFLDDFVSDKEPELLERWLRGLGPETDTGTARRFIRIAEGLTDWAIARSNFYLTLQPPPSPPPATYGEGPIAEMGPDRPTGGWAATNPVAGRFGLADVYWIARLLRADVSSNASVTYGHRSWLDLLAQQARLQGDMDREQSLRKAQEVLRSVFDFTCDLVQNAFEIVDEKEGKWFQPELHTELPGTTAAWRQTFDEELEEIELQRLRRTFRESAIQACQAARAPLQNDGWSQRIKTGQQPRNIIGLAFSGGGIRSATFNLGVIQGLQEFDLLRYVDYLSTVSGGGFIGSWLIANVKLTSHWLGRLTNWQASMAHLRRYSNYLAPSAGLLSADTWTMWGIWLRNASLIQLTGATWLAAILLAALAGQSLFRLAGEGPAVLLESVPASCVLVAVMAVPVVWTLLSNLNPKRKPGTQAASAGLVQGLAVLPSWIGSFLIAAILWGDATGRSVTGHSFANLSSYSEILRSAWAPWESLLLLAWIALSLIAAVTTARRRWHALWIGTATTATLYMLLCAIMFLFRRWSLELYRFDWYAFIFGPTLVLAVLALSLVLFIGFCGRNSREWIREWWTRFGAWLGIYGVFYLAATMSAVLGPLWVLSLLGFSPNIGAGTVAGWIGTVLAGLFAGNSSKTNGNGAQSKAPWLELLGKSAGSLFIIGGVLLVATTVYALMVNVGTKDLVSAAQYWKALNRIPLTALLAALAIALLFGSVFSWFFEINIFGLNQFYRNRLVRCYLGATRWAPGLRKPQPFTGFDGQDDMKLSNLAVDFRGPFPILNCSLNLGGSSDLALHTRHSASFTLTPLRCGSDRPRIGYAPTRKGDQEFGGGIMLGQAVAISGAAASPNMGYNTSPLVAFLLTMFNVRLGWWFPNPGKGQWYYGGLRFSLYYLMKELFGLAGENNLFVNVSDGGHFENLGVYELVRRRCKVIIASDAECDNALQFGSLGNLIRVCETDFGAKIDIDVNLIRLQKEGRSLAHCTVGTITYSNGSLGYLIYLKASTTGDEDVGVAQYRSQHPSFPHETTADQFFTESQFESYRRLGQHVVRHALRGIRPSSHPVEIAEKLYDVWAPAGVSNDAFIAHTKTLDRIWERFRQSTGLSELMNQLMGDRSATRCHATNEDVCACLELLQLTENVFLDLRLDDFWEHPDNRGWAMLFMGWARSSIFQAVWKQTRRTFGIRFEYFCEERLGLEREQPIARV